MGECSSPRKNAAKGRVSWNMPNPVEVISWACQFYLAFFFVRSAYRKTTRFERVKAEFEGWGYPFPGLIARLLSIIWCVCATAMLFPATAVLSATVLLAFMIAAFATLFIHGEYRRLVEPAIPIVLLLVVIMSAYR